MQWPGFLFGGDDGTRTHDPLLAKQVLCQLSYVPAADRHSQDRRPPAGPGGETAHSLGIATSGATTQG
jgi:hypothetical protein